MNPMQSLKEKRLEEFDKRYPGMLMTGDESGGHDAKPYILDFLSDSIDMAYEEGKRESNCPPHNFIPHKYEGNWGGSTPPPNMKCTKCLSTQYF